LLSIGSATGRYYADLAREDYYHAGGEPPGIWHGTEAERLGVGGEVNREEFLRLCEGYTKDGKEKLVQNAGKDSRRAGFDLTFSAPKSASVLWALSDDLTRKEIQDAQREAVKKALDYLEREAGYTRKGKGGEEHERCNLLFAMFEHGTSRAQDPHLHTHAVAINTTHREDGTTGALEPKEIFRHKMAAGAVYRAELSAQLEKRLGVEIEQGKKDTFEIAGVPHALAEEFSKRREVILSAMEKEGAKGAARAAHFTVTTREKKAHVARELLFDEWQEAGRAHGFSHEKVLAQTLPRLTDRELEKSFTAEAAAQKITETQSYFSEKEFVRRVAELCQGRGLGADDVHAAVKKYVTQEAVNLGKWEGEYFYTTKEVIALEEKMLSQVSDLKKSANYSPGTATIAIPSFLNQEQKKALYDITQETASIHAVSGMAGTGKTTLLKTAREFWEAQGYEVRGAALAAVAAKGLEDEAGIKSQTIAKFLMDSERAKDEGNGSTLTAKTILVIDEAGMVGTRQMSELVEAVHKSGGKIVLIGDERQLQPIEHGAPFKAIGERIGASTLQDIRRQRDDWARTAAKNFAFGESRTALQAYAERGLLSVSENRNEAKRELVSDWMKDTNYFKERLILAGTKAETGALNQQVQEARHSRGELGELSIKIKESILYENDRVLFTRNSKMYGVNNGDTGTVNGIDLKKRLLTVKLDSGEVVRITPERYDHVELGYAITTHKAQGKTDERAYVLAGGMMQDRELSYVQMSRTRRETKIYTEARDAGDTLTELSREMYKSRQKELATTFELRKEKELGRERDKERERVRE
jgi:Ti-type conjugative transfer relaxase TraA